MMLIDGYLDDKSIAILIYSLNRGDRLEATGSNWTSDFTCLGINGIVVSIDIDMPKVKSQIMSTS